MAFLPRMSGGGELYRTSSDMIWLGGGGEGGSEDFRRSNLFENEIIIIHQLEVTRKEYNNNDIYIIHSP
jgi:hypothetical protein